MLTSLILSMAMSATPAPVIETDNLQTQEISRGKSDMRISRGKSDMRISRGKSDMRISRGKSDMRI